MRFFYTKMDVLAMPRLSKYDLLVLIAAGIFLIGAVLTYSVVLGSGYSFGARMGTAIAYGCTLSGAGLHFFRQTKVKDELVNNILNKAIARAGMTTIIVMATVTLIGGFNSDISIGLLPLIAPILFILIAWGQARVIAKVYT